MQLVHDSRQQSLDTGIESRTVLGYTFAQSIEQSYRIHLRNCCQGIAHHGKRRRPYRRGGRSRCLRKNGCRIGNQQRHTIHILSGRFLFETSKQNLGNALDELTKTIHQLRSSAVQLLGFNVDLGKYLLLELRLHQTISHQFINVCYSIVELGQSITFDQFLCFSTQQFQVIHQTKNITLVLRVAGFLVSFCLHRLEHGCMNQLMNHGARTYNSILEIGTDQDNLWLLRMSKPSSSTFYTINSSCLRS